MRNGTLLLLMVLIWGHCLQFYFFILLILSGAGALLFVLLTSSNNTASDAPGNVTVQLNSIFDSRVFDLGVYNNRLSVVSGVGSEFIITTTNGSIIGRRLQQTIIALEVNSSISVVSQNRANEVIY